MLLALERPLGGGGLILSLLAMSQRTLLREGGLGGEKKPGNRESPPQRWGLGGEWPIVKARVCNGVLRVQNPGCRRRRAGLTSTL